MSQRKAPWLLTHTFVLAVSCGVLFLPPKHPIVLHVWFPQLVILRSPVVCLRRDSLRLAT